MNDGQQAARRSPVARSREPLLDLWRGLALIDMAWVHLAVYPIGMPAALAAWVGEYTRFAAGAFVLLSGMTVSRVFGAALAGSKAESAKARSRLFRRAFTLLVLGRLVSVAFAGIEQLRILVPDVARANHDLWGVAAFREPGVTGGLLLLYACLLVGVPSLATFQARYGRVWTLLVSFGVYAAADALRGFAHWPPWTFPLAQWQPFFVAGYVVAPQLERLRSADRRYRRICLGVVTASTALLFFVRNGAALGLAPSLGSPWDFGKVPLRPAEMAWYFLAATSALGWAGWAYVRWERVRAASAWICRLGRWSLLVYVAHLFLELPVVDFLTAFDPSPSGRAVMLVVVSMLLNAVAVAADGFERWRPATVDTPLAFVRRALPVSGSIGSGLAALCLGCVLVLARFGGSSRPFDVEHSGVEAEVAAVEAAMTFLPEVEATELGVQDVAIEEQVQTPAVSPETGASFEGLDITTEDGLLVH